MNEVKTISSNEAQQNAIENALMRNDLSALNVEERRSLYNQICKSMGLNPLTQPFGYLQLNGKLALYCKKDATDQLRKVHNISITITSREKIDDLYVVTARAVNTSTGRFDESTGVVALMKLNGDALANQFMKAETKAKRRVTLSICGLAMIDEMDIKTIAGAQPVNEDFAVKNATEVSNKIIADREPNHSHPAVQVEVMEGMEKRFGKKSDQNIAEDLGKPPVIVTPSVVNSPSSMSSSVVPPPIPKAGKQEGGEVQAAMDKIAKQLEDEKAPFYAHLTKLKDELGWSGQDVSIFGKKVSNKLMKDFNPVELQLLIKMMEAALKQQKGEPAL